MKKSLIPLAIFVVLVVFLAIGLNIDPREVPSPLIGKAAPGFSLPVLNRSGQQFNPAQMQGKVWLLNVWASWCSACRGEHAVINRFAAKHNINLIGFNYKDEATAAQRWLTQLGNPYQVTVLDLDGRVGIDWGVYGVPETFVIDKHGIIRHKYTGPLTELEIVQTLVPLLKQLDAES